MSEGTPKPRPEGALKEQSPTQGKTMMSDE
jgi:hypothetical protein